MINEKGVLKVYEKILRHKKKVNISIESKRIAKIFDYNSKIVYDIIKKKATEEFVEDEHPRDNDGKFATKGNQMFKTDVAFSQPIDILDDNKKRIDEMLKELEMMTKKGKLRKGDYKTNMSVKIKYNDEKYDDIYSLQTSIDRKTIYAVFRELGRMEYYSDIDESLVEKLDPYKKAVYNKMKRLHESIESDKSIKKIGFTGKLDIETTMNYRFNLEKSYVFGSAWGGTKEKREYADRIGTEVITPLINSDVHMYYIEDEHDDFFNKQIDEMLEYAYNELKYMNSKNIWTKELGNMMNVKLYSGSGEFNTKDFKLDELKSKEDFVASGFWGKDGNSINIFNRHPSYPFRNPTSQVLAHELTHSIFDARKRQAYDGDKDAKALLEKLTEVSINIDPEIVGKYLGTYAKSYVDTYHKEGRKGWGINLETELLSAITDSINPRYNNFFSGKKNYTVKTMKKHMPELMEVYEKIFGEEHKWEEDPQPKITFNDSVKQKHIPIGRIADHESDVSIEYDVQFIDGNRNIVPKEEATNVIRKGYRGNKLISFEHLIVPENPIVTEAEFKEEDHPRGQPDNAGQFTSKGDSSSKDALHIGKEEKEKMENYGNSLDIEPKKEEVDKAVNIESKVIGGVYDFIKDKSYKDKIKWVETQGSFAKGTDLGSSDLDIFIGFDYSLSIEEIEKITLEIGKNVLEPISDTNKYRIKHGADKDYPESNVDSVEVQIIGTSDVTLDQITKGFEEGGMKTATDRTPHHTRYMKKALKGKENEVRKVKKFFKEAGVYDSSIAKQGFSGFATEVLVDKLGSFGKVLEYFANFVKGNVIGKTDRKFDTPLVMVDPLDPNRNLAQAFSHSESDGNIAPNKNLARLIKTARSLFKTGKLPEITKEKIPSLSVKFHVDNTIDNNEVFGELYSSALKMSATLKRNGYAVKTPKDKIAEDFTIDVPRINVDYDKVSGEATLNFGLENFDKKKRYVGGIPEDFPKEKLQAFYDSHKGEKLVRKDGKLYAEQENEYPTAEKLMKAIVSREKKNASVGKLEKYIKQAVITQVDKEYENITDKPSVTEAGTSAGAKKAWDKRGRGRKEQIPILNPRKRDPTRVKLRKRDNPMKIQGKQRKYRQDTTSKILRKPEDFAGKQFIMKARIQEHFPKWIDEVGIDFVEEQIKQADTEWDGYDLLGIEMQEDLQKIVRKRGGTVTYRAKATMSSVEKLARLHDTPKNYNTVDDLKDRVGVRAVVEDIKDVYATVKSIKKYFREENPNHNITIEETTDYIGGKGHPDDTGYRSVHLIFKDKERGMKGEIQIRTKRQNLWSEVFHLAYKSEIKEVSDIYLANKPEIEGYGVGLSGAFYEQDRLTPREFKSGKGLVKLPKIPQAFKEMMGKSAKFQRYFKSLLHQYSLQEEYEDTHHSGEASVEGSRNRTDDMLDEIDEMTPETGFNVCLFDDYSPEGEMLTLVGNYDTIENANYIKKECEKQGQEAYIYPSKELNSNDDIEEEDVQKLAENLLEAEKRMVEKASKKFKNMP